VTKYQKYLRFLVKYIMDRAFDPDECGFTTEKSLADKAYLGASTINKLRTGYTKDPKHQTIWKLLIAVGIDPKVVAEEMAEVAAM